MSAAPPADAPMPAAPAPGAAAAGTTGPAAAVAAMSVGAKAARSVAAAETAVGGAATAGEAADPGASAPRLPVDVAVGVLVDACGRFLLTTRPEGKVYAGYWEFPGGKLEPGESVEAALRRELHEEIGIVVDAVERWRVETVDYPHARVRLHFCKVRVWHGEFEMREGQRMAWQTLPVEVAPVLPGTLPVLDWFAAERGHVGATLAG